MRVFSVHSQQDDEAKTKKSLSLAKQKSKNKKVCILDLDFLGLGINPFLDIGLRLTTLEDYFRNAKAHDFPIDKLLVNYDGFWIAPNLQKLTKPTKKQKQAKRQMIILTEGERVFREVEAKLRLLLQKLEEMEFDCAILNCHIGTEFITGSVMKIVDKRNQTWVD